MEVVYNVKVNTKEAVKESDKLVKSLDDIVDELKNVDKAIEKTDTENLEQSLKDLNSLVNSGTLNFEDYSKVLEQYTDIALKAGATSPIGKEAIQNAAGLKQEYQSVETAIDALSQKGSNLQASLQLGETVVAGYQAFIGIQALVGDENEELIEVLTKLQAVQGIAQGLQTVRNALDKESLILIKGKALTEKIFGTALKKNVVTTVASTTASSAQATATTGAAAAQTALNVAMNANPILLIITAIVALISTLVIFIATTNDAKDAQKDFQNAIEDVEAEMDRYNRTIERRTTLLENDLKNTNKLIELDIKRLESIKSRTQAEEDELKAKYGEKRANDVSILDAQLNQAKETTKGFSKVFTAEFDAIKNSITALNTEDGVDNIDYKEIQKDIESFRLSVQSTFASANTDTKGFNESVEKLKKNFEGLQGQTKKIRSSFEGDADELELLQVLEDNLLKVNSTIDDSVVAFDGYKKAVANRDIIEQTQAQEEAIERVKKQEEAREQASRRRRERQAELAREAERLAALQIAYEKRNQDIQIALIEDSYEREFSALALKLDRELDAIEGNSEQANALRETLYEQYVRTEAEINKRREIETLTAETALLDKIKGIRESYVLEEDSNENKLANLLEQQQAELALFREGLENELITVQEFDEFRLQQQKAYNDARVAIEAEAEEKIRADKEATRQQQLSITGSILDTASTTAQSLISLNDLVTSVQIKNAEGNEKRQEQIRKESFEKNKKLQIALAVISGIQGVINALTAQSVIPEPFGTILKVASAVAVGVATAANVAKISSTKYGGGSSGGSPSIPSASVSTGAGASQVAGRDLSDIRTDLTNNNTSSEQNVTQVVVLESDITGTQDAVAAVQQKTTF